MNNVLDFIGAYLYVIFCIVTFPVYVILQVFIGLLIASKFISNYSKSLFKLLGMGVKKRPYQMPRMEKLVIIRKAA